MIRVIPVDFADARARALWDEQQSELAARYGEPDADGNLPPDGVIVSLLADSIDGEAIGTVLGRWSPYHLQTPGTVEVKRLFVREGHRGNGYSKVLMGALEASVAKAGATRLALETGLRQPEAIGLYSSIGYTDAEQFGPYEGEAESVCMAKPLPTRVLVVNGTMGAGKTTTAAAVHDVLMERGVRSAFIDADALCQAEPAPAGDPFNEALCFENLAAMAPNLRSRGYGCVVVARVVEREADRDRYAQAFASEAGAAQVAIVRVTADADVRTARLTAREPEGKWRDFALARTAELHEILERLDLDDAAVPTDGLTRLEVAAQVVDSVGW